ESVQQSRPGCMRRHETRAAFLFGSCGAKQVGSITGDALSRGTPMRILIVDDHPIVASGCRAVLADEGEIEILEAADDEEGECVFIVERPDLSIIDINLPTVSGFELARRILERAPEARIIMFRMIDHP